MPDSSSDVSGGRPPRLPGIGRRILMQSSVAFVLGLLWVYAAHFLRIGLLGDRSGIWYPNGAEYLLGNLIFALQCMLLGIAFLAGPIFFRVMYGRNGFLVSFFLSPIFFFLAVVVFVLQQGPPMIGNSVF